MHISLSFFPGIPLPLVIRISFLFIIFCMFVCGVLIVIIVIYEHTFEH
jgi:hypothetical protein